MNWRVVLRPEVAQDISDAADWYDARQTGLGAEFIEEVIQVWERLAENPLLNARKHPSKNIRWRLAERFPYQVIYQVDADEHTVVVAAVLHAARHDRHWQRRV